jgi:hypothetical protein
MTISEQRTAAAAQALREKLESLGLKSELFGNEPQLLQWLIERCSPTEFTTLSLLNFAAETAHIYDNWNELLEALSILKNKQLIIVQQEGQILKVKLHVKLAEIN